MKKICVFTGAGIGVPLGLPITTGFNSVLQEGDAKLRGHITKYLGNDQNDIEKVLFVLEEFVQNSGFVHHIIDSKISNSNFQVVKTQIDQLVDVAKTQLLQIKSAVYDLLEEYDAAKAYQLYSNIIDEIRDLFSDSSMSFFTTNYDLTFENAIYENKEDLNSKGIENVFYGFQTDLGRQLFTSDQDFKWAINTIEYLKLHGSLDWSTDAIGSCAKSGISVKPADPDSMPLLYPGYKGTPSKEPFISLHERLYTRLIEADLVLIIGFAFRDPYINSIFEFALKANKKVQMLCFNPSKPDKLPSESKLNYFNTTFKHFRHIEAGITLEENSLGLKKNLELKVNATPKKR